VSDRDQYGSSSLSHQQFSDLIGAIYDCAIDPDIWPQTIEKICGALRCVLGAIDVIDLQRSQVLFVKAWNYDLSRAAAYADDIQYVLRLGPILSQPIDEPWSAVRLMSVEQAMETQLVKEWTAPAGHVDSLQTIVFRDSMRVGLFGAVRHESVGAGTDDDLAILRMLAPHIRRAITISDLLGMKALEAQALAATLDTLAAGVIVVAADHRVLFANAAANRMFAAGGPIRSVQGKLVAVAADANAELSRAIALAHDDEADIGKVGIGISLQAAGGDPAIAHVLPLARGDVRARLLPQAIAAVFVTRPGEASPADLSAFASTFGLTPAETRLLQSLIRGGSTLVETAQALSITEATAKTHLSRIFSKTGVTRQADLVALIKDLTPPVGKQSK
jgi:DNA-binding CsgD family transcriptional regulator/PAS domain-containing protein